MVLCCDWIVLRATLKRTPSLVSFLPPHHHHHNCFTYRFEWLSCELRFVCGFLAHIHNYLRPGQLILFTFQHPGFNFLQLKLLGTGKAITKQFPSMFRTKKERKELTMKKRKLRKELIVEEKKRKESAEKIKTKQNKKLTREEEKKAKKLVTQLNPQVSGTPCTDPLCTWRTQKDIFLANKRSCSGHNSLNTISRVS